MKALLIIFLLVATARCGMLVRSEASGYAHNYGQKSSNLQSYYQERKSFQMNKAKEEIGYSNTRVLNEQERSELYLHMRLKRMEKTLKTEREKRQYYSFKPFIHSTRDKLQFLQIPTYEGRQRWATAKGFIERSTKHGAPVNKAIEEKDILPGMNKKAVVESWGEPDLVEVSGNPMYENERWLYKSIVSSTDGFENENRIIYFEFGRVSGWNRE